MDDNENIVQQILIATCPPPGIDSNTFIHAQNFVEQLQQSPQCLQWIFETFNSQSDIRVKIQQLLIIKRLCKYSWENFNQELIGQLRQLLFTEQNHQVFASDQTYTNVVADTQLSFMWKAFPNVWPTFWQDLFASMSPQSITNFIYSLTKYASILMGNDHMIYNNIKNAMRENESDARVTKFVVDLMKTQKPEAFEIFESLCKWVNVNYILTNEAMSAVINCLMLPNLSKYCLDILTSLVTRGMPADNKFMLIQNLQIPNQIATILNQFHDSEIAYSAARLLNAAGQDVLNHQLCEQFAEMSLNFLMHPDSNVSSAVIPFLMVLCKARPQGSAVILDKAITRLENFFIFSVQNNNGYIERLDYIEQITMLTHTALDQNKPNNFSLLIQLWGDGSILEQNLPKACAIIHCIHDALSNGDEKEIIYEFVQRFYPIVQIAAPLRPLQIFGLTDFIRFFTAIGNNFQKEQISAVFNDICRLSFSTNVPDDEIKSDLAGMLVTFIKKMDKKIEFDPQIIYHCVSTLDEQFVSAAGLLIRNLTVNQGPIFEECMRQISNVLQTNNNSNQIRVALSFIKSLHYSKDAPHLQHVSNFLDSNMEMFCKNEPSIFALYIRTVYSSLGEKGFPILMKCVEPSVVSCTTLCAMSDALQALLKSNDLPKDWINAALSSIIEPSINMFYSVQSWENTESEENKEILKMACSFISLFSFALKFAFQFIHQNILSYMSNFVSNTLSNHFDNPDLIEHILSLLDQMLKVEYFSSTVFDNLCFCAMNFIYSFKFNPMTKPWQKVCERLTKLHIDMKNMNPDRAFECIVRSFQIVGAQQPQIEEYIKVLTHERPRDVRAHAREFFINFKKFRDSLGR